MRIATAATLLLLSAVGLRARESTWLETVAPVITAAEKRAYLSLTPQAQEQFRQNFWADKSITAEEYYRRLEYVDATFGSTKTASGANTDPGRAYLSLGRPDHLTRIPSSRVFAPLEIWYYNKVPAIHLNTELRLIFYQKNSLGLLKLYSPTLDTIRSLLLPQSSTISMFGPNDDLTESDVRRNLDVGPAEDEVITAAVGVASGIKRTGNDELLAHIVSPEFMLSKRQQTDVESRFIVSRPRLDIVQSVSPFAGRQVDFVLSAAVRHQIDMQILDGLASVYQNQVRFKFDQAEAIQYVHRLDLLPGSYTAVFSIDGKSFPYALSIPEHTPMGDISRVNEILDGGHSQKPLLFEGRAFTLSESGRSALVTLPEAGEVTWIVRKNLQVLTKYTSTKSLVSSFDLSSLPSGHYTVEASYNGLSRVSDVAVGNEMPPVAILVSFNANLLPALRWSFVGHQWLLRNSLSEARRCLEASLKLGDTKAAEVELARAESLAGDWDAARNRVRRILAKQPNDFDALTVLAYVETKLQDYTVAADLYRRALAVQDSPALRMALAQLPRTSVAN